MSLLDRLKKKKAPRLAVIALDGVPFTFMQKEIERGNLPELGKLAQGGTFRQMRSVHPCVSSVAWTSFSTGEQAGEHNIYGFIDRNPATGDLFIPNARSIPCKFLYEELGEAGHRVGVINVPVTYPPRRVNGLLVSGFLAPNVQKATYPTELSRRLGKMGYIVDVNPAKGREEDKGPFLDELHAAVDARFRLYNELLDEGGWDYLHLHVMETDRINHFLWEAYETGDATYAEKFLDLYRHIDREVGRTVERLPEETPLLLLSDHGFCGIEREVFVNHYLVEKGWLTLGKAGAPNLAEAVAPESRAYSLIPGRIYVNLKGREKAGTVEKAAFDEVRGGLTEDLLKLVDPDSGRPVIREVIRREDLYHGQSEANAPDLLAVPHDGFDLKGNLAAKSLTSKGPLNGMHTFHDAFLITRGFRVEGNGDLSIKDLKPSIFAHFEMA
jgi:predicted AlkP superfamily phosphohydrolase/phosphomutase